MQVKIKKYNKFHSSFTYINLYKLVNDYFQNCCSEIGEVFWDLQQVLYITGLQNDKEIQQKKLNNVENWFFWQSGKTAVNKKGNKKNFFKITWNTVGFFMYGKFSDSTGIKNCGALTRE